MLALFVDWNQRELLPDRNQAAFIFFEDGVNPPALEQKMETGLRVTLYDSAERWDGVLRPGTWHPWVAELIPGTARDLMPGEFERLQAETLRAADESD